MAFQVLPGRLDLESYAGDDFEAILAFTDSSGAAYSVTAADFTATIKRAAADLTITVTQESASSLRLAITDTTLGTSLSQDRWELRHVASDRTWLAGDFTVSLNRGPGSGPSTANVVVGTATYTGTVSAPAVLADGAVTTAKLADGAVTASKVAADVATQAELDAVQALVVQRANHTGTQVASTISDLSEAVDDRVAALLTAGTNVTLTYDDVAGTLTIAATGGGGIVHKFTKRATGSAMTVAPASTTTWSDLGAATNGPGAAGFDFSFAAAEGDVIEYAVNFLVGDEVNGIYFDVATIVGGAPTNYFAGSGAGSDQGVAGWRGEASALRNTAGAAWRTLVAGDISAGTVTVRLMYRCTVASTTKTIHSTAGIPFFIEVKNLGAAA